MTDRNVWLTVTDKNVCPTDMDWSKFFSMGGYGFYIWGTYLISLIVIGAEVVSLALRKRNLTRKTSARLNSTGST